MITGVASLFRNRNFIMTLALIVGLLWDGGSLWLKDLALPALAVVMTLSTMAVRADAFRSFRAMVSPAVAANLLAYLFHAGLLLLLATFFVKEEALWAGFVLLAAVPPAVAVIPFAFFLKGDPNYALFGTIGAYLGALLFTPLIAVIFLGSGFISPFKVLTILMELIVAPLIASRILLWVGASRRIEPIKGPLINWSFFLIIYVMTGLNREIFLERPLTLIPVILLSLASTFLFGWIIERAGIHFRIEKPVLTSLTLLGTFKNYGLAGGLALVFFGPETALPATVGSAIGILYMIFLEWKK
jgi:BASS family bile acid:Na+ symporter